MSPLAMECGFAWVKIHIRVGLVFYVVMEAIMVFPMNKISLPLKIPSSVHCLYMEKDFQKLKILQEI